LSLVFSATSLSEREAGGQPTLNYFASLRVQGKQPTTNNQQPATSNQQPTTNNQQPATNNQQPTTNN